MSRATIISTIQSVVETARVLNVYYLGFRPDEKEAILDDAREYLTTAEYRKAVDLLTINCHTPAGQAFCLDGWTFVHAAKVRELVAELEYYGGFSSGGQ